MTVLAPRGSHISGATIVDLGLAADPAAALRPGTDSAAVSMTGVFRRVSDHLAGADADIVHAHAFDAPAFTELRGPRLLHTLHLPPFDRAIVAAVRSSSAMLATVSESCRAAWRAAGVDVRDTLPNGIDIERVPRGEGTGGYLAFAGRLSAEKGADVACRVARSLGLPLWLAGPRYDDDWFRANIEPQLGGDVTYLGALERVALWRVLGGALATVLPVRWDEPFGMIALESIACGTPVAAYRRGGLTEVVADGRSGSFAPPDDERALAAAIGEARGLSRSDCRADASRHSLERMLDAHEALYRRMAA